MGPIFAYSTSNSCVRELKLLFLSTEYHGFEEADITAFFWLNKKDFILQQKGFFQ